jgi:hypothetical protein
LDRLFIGINQWAHKLIGEIPLREKTESFTDNRWRLPAVKAYR